MDHIRPSNARSMPVFLLVFCPKSTLFQDFLKSFWFKTDFWFKIAPALTYRAIGSA
jgi:hypothetical protein